MPISTFTGLQTSLRGLLAHQQAIDTTSHNISNANTDGYSRQEAVMDPSAAYEVIAGTGNIAHLGTGVDVEGYRRIRDAFLDHLVRLIGQEPDTGYRPGGNEPVPTHRVIDAQA